MSKLRFIGDVHGRYDLYLPLLSGVDFSIQVGDLGLNYKYLREQEVEWGRHWAIAGNHDNYGAGEEHFFSQDFTLERFGALSVWNKARLFYVGGGWSIDQKYRTPDVDWWPEEELSTKELSEALSAYRKFKPDILVSHEAPYGCVSHVTDPAFARRFGFDGAVQTRTSIALQRMIEHHRPVYSVFGHYHHEGGKIFKLPNRSTTFVHLDMIRPGGTGHYFDIDF